MSMVRDACTGENPCRHAMFHRTFSLQGAVEGSTLGKMMKWFRRLLLAGTFFGLLATNILTLTSTAFNAAISGLMTTALGVQTVAGAMHNKLEARDRKIHQQKAAARQSKLATRQFGTRLTARTKRVAAKSIAAIPAESIPFIGVAVLIADTGYELYAACETMRDLDQLYDSMGVTGNTVDGTMRDVCQPDLPDADRVWRDVSRNFDQWWSTLLEAT